MKVHVFNNEDAASLAAAMMVCAQVLAKPDALIALEKAEDLQSTYQKLLALYKAGSLALHDTKFFNAVEYCQIEPEKSQGELLQADFLRQTDCPQENFYNFAYRENDFIRAAADYEQKIQESGSLDLAIITVADDGSILLNQPAPYILNDCHFTKALRNSSIQPTINPAIEQIPGLTMGMGTLMRAHMIIFPAYGKDKAPAVANLVRGQIDPSCPASFLQLHSCVILLLDEAAAALI